MTEYELLETDDFSKEFFKLPIEIQLRFDKQFRRLVLDPYGIGDPIKGRRWFRELKNKKYRVYYVIFEDKVVVMLVGISVKKNQQKTIDEIMDGLDKWKQMSR